MKTIPFLEDLLFGSEILFCPRGIINKPTVRTMQLFRLNEIEMERTENI